jgi:hypothetical protein
MIAMGAGVLFACKKNPGSGPGNGPGGGNPPPDTTTIQPPVEPPIATSIGFFLNDWQGKTFTDPSFVDTAMPASAGNTVTVDPSAIITKVPPTLFGNNSNPYMTPIVTEASLMTHLKDLNPHIMRFPGGSISDVYFWNTSGGAPADVPDTLFDGNGNPTVAGYWNGMNTANWTMTVDNYYTLLQQTNSAGVITVNYAYARYGTGPNPVATAAHLAADWVRYDNGRTKYWEIGNEDNGTWEASYKIDVNKNHDHQPAIIGGGLYGQHVKVFADSMRAAAQQLGKTIYIGAQLLGTAPASWQDSTDQHWNAGVFAQAGNTVDFYIIHNYYSPYNTNSNAATILSSAATETQAIMSYVQQNAQANGASLKPVAMTEWNISAVGSMQMVSHVSGMHAVLTLGEMLKNKFGEASRWDLANGWDHGNDQGMFNIGDETDGVPKWNPRPAFYHMYFFQKFLGDRLVSSTSSAGSVSTYASSFSSGQAGVTLVNTSTSNVPVQVTVKNFRMGNRCYWFTLTGGTDNGEFSGQVFVNGHGPSGANGGPDSYATLKPYSATIQNGLRLNLPPRSVTMVVIDKQ